MPKIKISNEFLNSLELQYAIQQGYSFTNENKNISKYSIFDVSGPNLEIFQDDEFIDLVFISKNDYDFSWNIKIKKAI